MQRPGPPPQRPSSMNLLNFNRNASGGAPSPGYNYLPRPSPGGAASGGSNPFNRGFPFGSSSLPPHLAAFGNQPQQQTTGTGQQAQQGQSSLNINDFPALGGSFSSNAGAGGNMNYANSTAGGRGEGLSSDDFPSLSDGFAANGTASNVGANQEQASAAATLQHQRLAREQSQSQTLNAARGGFGEPERNYATKVGMQQPPGISSQNWFASGFPNAPAPSSSAPGLNGVGMGVPISGHALSNQPSVVDDVEGRARSGLSNAANVSTPSKAKTPAQQVLTSPADRFGLLGLVSIIRMHDPDLSMLTLGNDLQSMGLNLDSQDPLSTSFVTPWSDNAAAAALQIEPEFHLPSCYNVHAPPAPQSKIASFSDETLFFIFYSAPRDVLQEVAAQELYNRNWRFYRGGLNLWLTKEENVQPTHKDLRAEKGVYIFWDPTTWSKVSREFVLAYDALEERSMGVSQAALLVPGAGTPSQQNAQPGLAGVSQGTPAQQHQGPQVQA